ncbi:MAG: sterol desaturase family protein [Methylovulum sp.]|jgi:sterol desaturase/sphingolipid hydroxylase (fatty acid hydroxylase superfamily)|nr:sterol desaturase family protein [Methylovulum sp.]MCF7999048.1 sterol desaturase family protein [Methylovulum sp.]
MLSIPTEWSFSFSGELAAFMLLLVFCVLAKLELIFPLAISSANVRRHSYKANLSLLLFNSMLISALSKLSLFSIARYFPVEGLLDYVNEGWWWGILEFVLLDLLLYLWHKASHQLDHLWMFHRVHHNDPCLNLSTAFRVHCIELCIINSVKAIYIVVLGLDQMTVLINEFMSTLFVMFHHTNFKLKGERWLSLIIIVPSLHRTHHSVQRAEHDSNYGAVFSLWDRLFGTLLNLQPTEIGIKGKSPQQFMALLRFGFALPSTSPLSTISTTLDLDHMIAEAAYYRAEKRDFRPGYELMDWLEAKKEILQLVYGNRSTMSNHLRQIRGIKSAV